MKCVKSVCSSSLDFISDLPSSVIENILMCLSLPNAVKTSILSRKWRYKWLTLPQLVFDMCQQFPRKLLSDKHKLMTIIYQVLLCHKGPILKFDLSNPVLESCSDINHWILFLSNNNIQDFALHIWRAEIFGSFISSCPLLEQLTWNGRTSFECLEIDAPDLKILSFIGTFKSICFKNTPLLAIATIELDRMAENVEHLVEGETSKLIKVFGCLPLIEKLCVSGYFLKFLAVGNVLKEVPIALKHIRNLKIYDLCFTKMDEISCALCLIRSPPNLCKLKISGSRNTNDFMKPVVEFMQAQDSSNWSLNQLRKVTMLFISGVEPELEFIKFLLANSTVLETMYILHSQRKVTDGDGGLKTLKELTRFCRASPKAEIIYSQSRTFDLD